MLRLRVLVNIGLGTLMLIGAGCVGADEGGDGRGQSFTQPANVIEGLRTALVANVERDGTVTSHSESYTEEQYQALVAARKARRTGGRSAPAATLASGDGVETASSALIQPIGCPDDNALWAYDRPDGQGAWLCLTGTGVYDLNSIGWKGLVQSVWPGEMGGQISDEPICNRYWACTTWDSWGPLQNTPLCTSIVWGQYVAMPQTCY